MLQYTVCWRGRGGLTAKVYIKHFFFSTFMPALLINILHPKVSAVPSAQASPGPHAWSILQPVCSRPGPKVTVSKQTSFYISFMSDRFYGFVLFVMACECMCVFLCF